MRAPPGMFDALDVLALLREQTALLERICRALEH